MPSRSSVLRLATRRSPLALWQTQFVVKQLHHIQPQLRTEIVPITTRGDSVSGSLAELGGKGLFVSALEEALLKDEADCAVHSLKDMPYDLPAGLCLAALMTRHDVRDILLTHAGNTLNSLPPGTVIGTASPRRQALVSALCHQVYSTPLRGNIHTRLKKWHNGECDALILAAAGLLRLQIMPDNAHWLDPLIFPPAAGQGIIAVQGRSDDPQWLQLFGELNNDISVRCADAERRCVHLLGGNCYSAIAAYAYIEADDIILHAAVGNTDGCLYRARARTPSSKQAAEIAAHDLLAQGATALLSL